MTADYLNSYVEYNNKTTPTKLCQILSDKEVRQMTSSENKLKGLKDISIMNLHANSKIRATLKSESYL